MKRLLLAPLIFTLFSPIGLMAHEEEAEDFSKIIQEIKECTDKGNCSDFQSESFEKQCDYDYQIKKMKEQGTPQLNGVPVISPLCPDIDSLKSKAIKLVIKKYDKKLKKRLEGTGVNPSYMAEAASKCNVSVRAGTHQPTTWSVMEWFEVNVCKGQVKLIDLTKR